MRPLYNDFLTVVKTIIESNCYDDSFGCPELCEKLGMSRSQVHRKLKAQVNLSTSEFIKQIRLEKARNLLIETDRPINEIAYKVGYSDANYFSRLFSSIFGISPSQYRQPLGNLA